MMDVVVKYVEGAREDLKTAKALIDNALPFYVPFICHQALFKLLRGYFLENENKYPPYEPNLPTLARLASVDGLLGEEEMSLLGELSYYPDVIGQSVYREKLLKNAGAAAEILAKTQRLTSKLIDRIG